MTDSFKKRTTLLSRLTRTLAAPAALAFVLAACEPPAEEPEEPEIEGAEDVEEAMDEAGDAVEEVADEAGDAVEEADEASEEGMDEQPEEDMSEDDTE